MHEHGVTGWPDPTPQDVNAGFAAVTFTVTGAGILTGTGIDTNAAYGQDAMAPGRIGRGRPVTGSEKFVA
jgi:hypothetical protein